MEHKNFISARIEDDVASGRTPRVVLRFPPEPNGYLHLGHVKSIILNASLAEAFGGELNLRFDDTNPKAESTEYVEAIRRDATWLTGRFTRVVWASDYFETLYRCAVHLIEKGLAYVDDSSVEEMRSLRGDFGRPGVASSYRGRPVAENLSLFARMRAGEFADGSKVLRARIDLTHSNMAMRDPALYRISHTEHHNTGTAWCIYPMYDFAHPLSDALEGVTHSLCTLEFEDHRPLYDWVVEHCLEVTGAKPVQIEFARLDVEGVVLSKRKLNALVTEGKVSGWDSPALPTVAGLRRRGMTADILREFVLRCGFSKANSEVPASVLGECVCDVLGPVVDRRMAVMDPVELVLENLTESFSVEVPNHPRDESRGHRPLTLSPSVWVDRADIRPEAEADFWRIFPGSWVRLKHGLNVLIHRVEVDNGRIVRVVGEADLGSRNMKDARHKAKAVLHWLSTDDSELATIASYGPLFDADGAFDAASVSTSTARVEKNLPEDAHFEFERVGYFYKGPDGLHHLTGLKAGGKAAKKAKG